MHRDFNRPETQSRAVSSDGSVNVVLEPPEDAKKKDMPADPKEE